MKTMISNLAIAVLATTAFMQAPARAENLPLPLALNDMSAQTKLDVDIGLVPGDGVFGLVPKVGFQYGNGNFSGAIYLPMALALPDQGDSAFVIGNPTLNGTSTICLGGSLGICVGGSLDVGIGVFDPSGDPMKGLAYGLGQVAFQNNAYFSSQNLDLRPMGLAALRIDNLVVQAQLGLDILVPLQNTSGRDTQLGLIYGIGASLHLMDLIQPMLELQGASGLSDGLDFTQFWLNFGARLTLGGFQPFLRLSVPMTDQAKATADVQIATGFAWQF